MNYLNIYNKLIKRGKDRQLDKTVYAETHHIIPRCMGGTDSPENLVRLTPEEHLLAHLLLIRIDPTNGSLKVALHWMFQGEWPGRNGALNKKYANWRRMVVEDLKKLKWWTNGKTHTRAEHCPGPDYRPGMLSEAWNKGIPRTAEERAAQSARLKGRSQPKKTTEAMANSGHAGTDWWTNGIKNKRAIECPGDEWYRGFTARKVGSKGMQWYNNGLESRLFLEPQVGWSKGRLRKSS